ncbi:MAG: hypothetical protein AAF602_11805 [Myxococcota bacterium]
MVNDPFIGRRGELGALRAALDDGRRLVTLTGLGGIGKTCLASELASVRPEPTVFVGLSACATEDDWTAAVAAAMPDPTVTDGRDLGSAIQDLGPVLVILDAFERVAAFATPFVARWLRQAPRACFVVTSRMPLELDGELRILLGPLADDAARELLVRRVRDVDFRFDPSTDEAAVDGIVARLEGIPLALELAAARLQTLSPRQLLARLDDRLAILTSERRHLPARHVALEAALDDTWAMLSRHDQAALVRCSVFAGSFRVDAAEEVVGDQGSIAALDQVQRLVAGGLLRVITSGGERRLDVLDVLREYAARHREAESHDRAVKRHAAHYLQRVATLVTPEGFARRVHTGVDPTLHDEVHDLEAIVDRATLSLDQRLDAALAVVVVLGHTGPAARLVRSLSVVGRLLDDGDVARVGKLDTALYYASRFEGIDPPDVERVIRGATAAAQDGRTDWAALLAFVAGSLLSAEGRTSEAGSWLDRAVELAANDGQALHAMCLEGPATLRSHTGSVPEAQQAAEAMVELGESLAHARFLGVWLNHRSVVHFDLGAIDRALADVDRALTISAHSVEPTPPLGALMNRVEYLFAANRREEAWATLRDARRLQAETGKQVSPLAGFSRAETLMALAEGDLDRADAVLDGPRRSRASKRPTLESAVAASGRGMVALLRGDDAAALDHLEAAIAAQQRLDGERTDLCIDLALRALARGRVGPVAGAREDWRAALDEAEPWQCPRFEAVLGLLGAAIELRAAGPPAAEGARRRLAELREGRVVGYAEAWVAARLVEAELANLPAA